jgi:hypothetical protein
MQPRTSRILADFHAESDPTVAASTTPDPLPRSGQCSVRETAFAKEPRTCVRSPAAAASRSSGQKEASRSRTSNWQPLLTLVRRNGTCFTASSARGSILVAVPCAPSGVCRRVRLRATPLFWFRDLTAKMGSVPRCLLDSHDDDGAVVVTVGAVALRTGVIGRRRKNDVSDRFRRHGVADTRQT